MPQPIQLNRTTNPANVPPLLFEGEPAVAVAPGLTRLWIGDGAANRLLLSSNPADPLGPPIATANYLALSGGTMAGQIVTLPPVAAGDAVNKNYVDTNIAALRSFIGTWQVAANTPDITGGAPTPGDYYIAVTAVPSVAEVAPVGIPGIAGQTINNGDMVIWDAVGSIWELIRGGPLTVAEADALYLQLVGGTMTGPLVLSADPTVGGEAATKNYVDGLAGQFLPLTGGDLSGNIRFTQGTATISGFNPNTVLNITAASGGGLGRDGGQLNLNGGAANATFFGGNITVASGNNATGGGTQNGQVTIQTGTAPRLTIHPVNGITVGLNTTFTLFADPVTDLQAATKRYVDAVAGGGGPVTVVADGVSITGDGAIATPLTVALIDGGTF
jgi:hypothetical protein